ncbi:uncharacterized protein BDV17DRAFT_271327, partial [Aspergillus undulatus]|uniref:uncharacterized protein n=1 Tax=Aspergillus undulatus TaxID=1810928 RepID=UPI003CCD0774
MSKGRTRSGSISLCEDKPVSMDRLLARAAVNFEDSAPIVVVVGKGRRSWRVRKVLKLTRS